MLQCGAITETFGNRKFSLYFFFTNKVVHLDNQTTSRTEIAYYVSHEILGCINGGEIIGLKQFFSLDIFDGGIPESKIRILLL